MSRGVKAEASADLLLAEARGLSGDFDGLSQAVALRVGLSSTDLLAMDLISRDGSVTAGQLAEHLHLTTGAITGVIDRLERSGYARRRTDGSDRRLVRVVPTAKGDQIGEFFAPLAIALRRAIQGHSKKDLATLTEFLRVMRAAVAETSERIRRPGEA